MRNFAISDIHGSYDEMMKLFHHVKLDPKVDQLTVIGDMIDRGPDSGRVLKELYRMQQTYPLVRVLAGNHEEMMLWYVDQIDNMWMTYGGIAAANSINEVFKDTGVSEIIEWIRGLPLMLEEDDYIYAHAGIKVPYDKDDISRESLWLEKDYFYGIDKEALVSHSGDKIIVHGHTPDDCVTFDGIRLSIDLGAQVTDNPKLSLVELNEMIYYEYDFESGIITKKSIKED